MNSLLLEIGVEEMPVKYIQPAVETLSKNISEQLYTLRINHGYIRNFSTPRRLTVLVENIANEQKSITRQIYGPPESIAFDDDGSYSISAIKFANKINVPMNQLEVNTTHKGRYISAKKTECGQSTRVLLEGVLPKLILSIPFPKNMRWSDLSIYFARPIRTIVAILGSTVLNFELDHGINSGRNSTGHPFMSFGDVAIFDPDKYLKIMRKVSVIADIKERRNIIIRGINKAAQSVGGKILDDKNLLDIVTNLVEYPFIIVGSFDDIFLDIPKEILVTSMREQQRYFSVLNDEDILMPNFVAVSNIYSNNMDAIILGNERVLRARLSDAKFFYDSDVDEILDSVEPWVDKLKGILFHNELGSMYDKMLRIKSLASYLATKVDSNLSEKIIRTSYLCKSDLVSRVVSEFPKLQGIMGSIYARLRGESEKISTAIREHYLPLNSGGEIPTTKIGAVVSIADKIDSICGCFSIGLVPTGTTDPYALRRQTIGLLRTIHFMKLNFDFKELVEMGLKQYSQYAKNNSSVVVEEVCNFIRKKLLGLLLNVGYPSDIITAVISISSGNIIDIEKRILAIKNFKETGDLICIITVFKRIHNILNKCERVLDADISERLFEDNSEIELYRKYRDVNKKVVLFLAENDFGKILTEIATLYKPVNLFFDRVMVMVEDEGICCNRLALLKAIYKMFLKTANFSKIDL